MNGNSLGVVSTGAWAGAERSEGERSEPQRSGAPVHAGTLPVSRPNSEVVARPRRRSFTVEYKLRVLQEAEEAAAIQAASALYSGAKVCTRLCWLIGGGSGRRACGRR